MIMKKLIASIVAVGFLAACEENPQPGMSDIDPNALNLSAFMQWPSGEATTTDADAFMRDNLVFVVDRSGSMSDPACGGGGSKSEVVATELSKFMPQIPDHIAVGYVDFGNNAVVRVDLGVNNRTSLVNAANAHKADMGSTYVGHSIEVALKMLEEQSLKQNVTGTYRIVLIVDGGASDSQTVNRVLSKINNTPVEILTAGFCIGSGHILNQPNDMIYVEASDVDQLTAVLQQAVSAEAPAFNADFVTVTE